MTNDELDALIERATASIGDGPTRYQVASKFPLLTTFDIADLRAVAKAAIGHGSQLGSIAPEGETRAFPTAVLEQNARRALARELLEKDRGNRHEPDVLRYQDLCGWLREIAEEDA